MPETTDQGGEKPRRCVALRRDGDDFVAVFVPEDVVVFRNRDADALRRACVFLRWKIVSDTLPTGDD